MSELLPIAEMSLTRDAVSAGKQQASRWSSASITSQDSRQVLPALKDTLGQELKAERKIAPGPKQAPVLFVPGKSVLVLHGEPVRQYMIGGLIYNMQQPPDETRNTFTRTTVDQRHIQYSLEIVQQPEKARACGSGTKSSNDRRPVDPPPVVELKVFTNGIDTSQTYDATFMLYASLEVSRPIAGGKQHAPATIPVLAGVTVASAAYLEKPRRAAYFIFPDLSVRHEGWYRLRFSLFEGIKHSRDADIDKPFPSNPMANDSLNAPPVRHEGVFNRMDVVSIPFQVYSAKKFPGLNQSTELSVLVADQGCRVRIRRDVRQRKRQQKSSGAEGDDAPSSYQGSPHASYRALDHPRTDSRNSLGSYYEGDLQRRESVMSGYCRPGMQSRQLSTSTTSATSPLPSMSSMPPPHFVPRPMLSNFPTPTSTFAPYRTGQNLVSPTTSSMLQEIISPAAEGHPHGPKLPPLQMNGMSEVRQRPSTQRYNVEPVVATKRTHSPNTYSQHTALKDRGRPVSLAAYSARTFAPCDNDTIEPDDGDEDDDLNLLTGDLKFSRANGTVREVMALPGSRWQR